MIRAVYLWTLLALLSAQTLLSWGAADQSRLAGLYVKDGNENGQLRFLASGLNSNTNGVSGSNGLNAALNSYITNKQDMLEQLRPTSTNAGSGLGVTGTGTGTGTGLGLGTLTGTLTGTGTGTGTGTSNTAANNAIYVSLGNGNASPTGSNTQAALNQAIYGSTPVNNLLPQIVGQAIAQRTRPADNSNRRRVVQQRRRRVNKKTNGRRRRRKGNKNGKKRPQVVVVRPNRG
ncbi:putative per-hexamer repeat protein 5 [Drosophila novamexicana]|uniref:putative per-hexamer repeat protein 5 n=1 Tax=Drosophila novamexicana TaxID=47314 RepID=UPI0011E5CBD9|nr:putative per-hexamer repeat protein 5 [Drosophila novamexicana]